MAIGARQIAAVYGTSLRSTPVWFIRDDHDYFENDEYLDGAATFPPTAFRRDLTQRLQDMYWPSLPATAGQPELPGGGGSFGSLRWGQLAEFLLYDCRGHMSLAPGGGFVPPVVESWIADRSGDPSIRHVVQTPSTPWGWTAGKWGEWYPDVRGADGRLTGTAAKPGWNPGWFEQHQRLLALAGSRGRPALVLSGDLHAVGCGQIVQSHDVRPDQPVHMVLAGPIGTDELSFPSAARGGGPEIPAGLLVREALAPREENGFTVIDLTRETLRIRQFCWRAPQPVEDIPNLSPQLDLTIRA